MATKAVKFSDGSAPAADQPKIERIPAPILTEADIPPILDQPPPMLEPARLWTITPEMARFITKEQDNLIEINEAAGLKRTGRNRNIRWYGTNNYSRDMEAGNWRGRNGTTISRAWTGVWTDGQHRLQACLLADTPFETIVVFGVDPEDQDTIDTGIKRQVHDQLTLQGEPNAKALETVARWAWRWSRGARNRSAYAVPNPTQLEVIGFIEADERLRVAADWGLYAWRQSDHLARPSVYGLAWLIFHGIDHLSAEVFLEGVATGAMLEAGHPAMVWRRRMTAAVRRDERLTEHEQLALLILAWNAFRAERTISVLSLPDGGLKPTNFPEARLKR